MAVYILLRLSMTVVCQLMKVLIMKIIPYSDERDESDNDVHGSPPSPPASPPSPPSPPRNTYQLVHPVARPFELQQADGDVDIQQIAEQSRLDIERRTALRQLLEPIFPTSPFSVGAAAELLLGILERFGVTEAVMQTVVSIFTVLLPEDNVVPSYKQLKALVARVDQLEWKEYPVCSECREFVFTIEVL